MKVSRLQSALSSVFRPRITAPTAQARWRHKEAQSPLVPPPTPFIPDVQTFLKVIGRDLGRHAIKFPSWEALFTLTSDQLRELGVEPPRTRRYLIKWRQKFREGKFGPGGDLKYVENGAANLHVLEIEKDPLTRLKYAVNVPFGKKLGEVSREEMARVAGVRIDRVHTITGPFVLPTKGGRSARITVTEGMWEERRGVKVDGGERRRKEVRFMRRVAERRAAREEREKRGGGQV